MYYNSNSNDYYNSYKKELAELEAYRKEESLHKILKLILYILALILLSIATFYLYKYFNPSLTREDNVIQRENILSYENTLPQIILEEGELPQSIQLRQSNMQTTQNIQRNATDTQKSPKIVSTMSEQEVAKIVKVILSQMNIPKEVSLEQQLDEVNNQNFNTQDLEKTNHYNKIVLTHNALTEVKNASLVELSSNLNSIVNEKIDAPSDYAQTLTKEIQFRENEMRVIIVQKGDTLSRIAKKAYGNRNAYQKIFSANPEIIKNPNQIFIGQRLRIPS
ncbi:MAG: Ferric siderophore transport system, periplasmic binding protein TonB [uncultured Sulfurovum sp.]|uniref:Ferric siderophore transport system, periplasmic binding protein TonB n=1 Tax=uncultured Sulfurovum sp. TaxID=269237 RepID=A0A6S6UE55_9BACT|nr:MAG: Ferric siderophore transport system, periplasmic binding protein TonB [uncultured Sulfurovum sp.]